MAAALLAALLGTGAGAMPLLAVACKLSADCGGRTRKHSGDFSNAVVLLLETVDHHAIHAIFGLQLLVLSGALVHRLTLTGQVLHFRFESAIKFMVRLLLLPP